MGELKIDDEVYAAVRNGSTGQWVDYATVRSTAAASRGAYEDLAKRDGNSRQYPLVGVVRCRLVRA